MWSLSNKAEGNGILLNVSIIKILQAAGVPVKKLAVKKLSIGKCHFRVMFSMPLQGGLNKLMLAWTPRSTLP